MFEILFRPLVGALGALVALEALYLVVLRRSFTRLVERIRYHSFALAVAALVGLELSAGAAPEIAVAIAEFVAVVVTIDLVYRLLDRFWLSRQRDRDGRQAIPKLVRDLAAWLLVLAAGLVGAHVFFGMPYNAITLSATVVSAVVGFALQDVLKNVFAGLALQTEAPFEVGDWLLVDDDPRQVLEMTWRSTHLRSNLSVDYRVPNSKLADAEIVNLGAGSPPMGFEIEVALTYGAAPRLVKDSLERAARACPVVAPIPEPIALLHQFGDSGITYRLRFWSTHVYQVARMLDEVRTRAWYQLKRDGFTIPFPIRTVEYDAARDIAADKRRWEISRAKQLLDRVDFLAALPEAARERLAAGATHVQFDAGEKLVREGQQGESLFLVSRGRVVISKSGAEIGTSSVRLASLGEGDFFGEMSLLTGAPRSASVTAEDGVEVFELDRDALAPILQSDPSIAETLSRVLAARVAETVARFENRRDELSRQQAVEERSLLSKIRGFFRLGGSGNPGGPGPAPH